MRTSVTVKATDGNLTAADTGYIDGYVQKEKWNIPLAIVVIDSTDPQKIGTTKLSNLTPTDLREPSLM